MSISDAYPLYKHMLEEFIDILEQKADEDKTGEEERHLRKDARIELKACLKKLASLKNEDEFARVFQAEVFPGYLERKTTIYELQKGKERECRIVKIIMDEWKEFRKQWKSKIDDALEMPQKGSNDRQRRLDKAGHQREELFPSASNVDCPQEYIRLVPDPVNFFNTALL